MEKDEYKLFREKVEKAFSDTGDRERIAREFELIGKLGREEVCPRALENTRRSQEKSAELWNIRNGAPDENLRRKR